MQHWAGQNCMVDINECEDKNGNDCHFPFRRFILFFNILLPQLILLVNIVERDHLRKWPQPASMKSGTRAPR